VLVEANATGEEEPVTPAEHLLQEQSAGDDLDPFLGAVPLRAARDRRLAWTGEARGERLHVALVADRRLATPCERGVQNFEVVLEGADVIGGERRRYPLLLRQRAGRRLRESERTQIAILYRRAIEADGEFVR